MHYSGPIIDGHHHFWEPRLGKQPWLLPTAEIPFRYGDYSSIKTDYLPPDLQSDAQGLNLIGSVTMETEWEIDDPIGEMLYTKEIGERFNWPLVSVAHAVLVDPQVEAILEKLAGLDWVRSIRNKPGQSAQQSTYSPNDSLLSDPQWKQGFSLLETYGLNFDLQVAWWHFGQAIELANESPSQRIIVNHAGLPAERSNDALQAWEQQVRAIAQCENVTMKVSGIGVPNQEWTLENNRFVLETITDCFGPDRMIAASNFPVDRLAGTYAQIFGAFLEFTSSWSKDEQFAFFAGTAAECYGIDVAQWVKSH
ncbi:amidohydrolase family protein [Jonesiaceae bacterium BS-20]|uniref:Amidohydrolase family protein n=1 Tax=Jonesiaceae bacterium BS-20 TaxID=3120821 RepID=A0AAU7DUU0_9MICO